MIKLKDLKTFAYVWGIIFCVIAIYPLFKEENINKIFIAVSLSFIFIGIFKPITLTSFYKLWIKLGESIGNVVSKFIMFILYFGLFTPISIALKILGKDLLNKTVKKDTKTYWVTRDIQPQSMKNQF